MHYTRLIEHCNRWGLKYPSKKELVKTPIKVCYIMVNLTDFNMLFTLLQSENKQIVFHHLQEHSLTHEILRKVSPVEAKLIKDPSIKARVRFRYVSM